MDIQLLWYLIAAILILVGLAGTVLPALPGIPLMFAGMLLAAWAGGFEQVGTITLVILGALTLLSLLADVWATAMGVNRTGASRMALAGALIGMFIGLFFGIIGIFIGPFAGAAIGELLHLRSLDRRGIGQAARVGLGAWIGTVLSVALKLMIAFAMLGLFALVWLLA